MAARVFEGRVSQTRKECLREGADLTEHNFPSYVKINSIICTNKQQHSAFALSHAQHINTRAKSVCDKCTRERERGERERESMCIERREGREGDDAVHGYGHGM